MLKKATVNLLSDENCAKNMYLLTNKRVATDSKVLCTATEPYVLLANVRNFLAFEIFFNYAVIKLIVILLFQGDCGGPIMDKSNNLLGINFGICPDPKHTWDNFSVSILNQYGVNLHLSVDYYRTFIVKTTGYN